MLFFGSSFSEDGDEEAGRLLDVSTQLNETVDGSQDLSGDGDKSDVDDDSKAINRISETSDSGDDADDDVVKPLTKRSKVLSTSDDDDDGDDAQVTSSSNPRLVANCFFFHKLLSFKLAAAHDLSILVSIEAI